MTKYGSKYHSVLSAVAQLSCKRLHRQPFYAFRRSNVNFLLAKAKGWKDPMARKMACKQIDPTLSSESYSQPSGQKPEQ